MGYTGGDRSSDGGRVCMNSFSTIDRTRILGIATKILDIRTVGAISKLVVYVVYHIEHKWKVDDGMTNILYILSLIDRPELLDGPLVNCGMRKKPCRRGNSFTSRRNHIPCPRRHTILHKAGVSYLRITNVHASSNMITASVGASTSMRYSLCGVYKQHLPQQCQVEP